MAALVAVGFEWPYFVMALIGAAGLLYGLRSLRPQARDVEEFMRAREEGSPSRFGNFLASTSVVFALFSLLIGMLLLISGAMLMLLAP